MPAYKDSKTGTWFVKFYCKDWTGENKQIKKRGFATKREALDYERNYKIRQENNLDMTFGEFWKLYTEDMKNYVKLNTWLTKEHIVDTKILPYFKNLKMNEITPGDVRKWQNEMVAFRYENGKSYSQTYKKTMHNILSAIFNHACRFYNLKSNPARQAGNMGREEKKEMLFWTTEEYKKFSEAVIDNAPGTIYSSNASIQAFLELDYTQFISAIEFLYPEALFSTEHGVKGEEYDNVIFVISRGWNMYQFETYAPMITGKASIPSGKQISFERNRNLFYVCCSRPRKRLFFFVTIPIDQTFKEFLMELVGKENYYTYSQWIMNKKISQKSNEK